MAMEYDFERLKVYQEAVGFSEIVYDVTREYPSNNSPLICITNGGSVDCLQMDHIFCKGINNVVDARGTISHISASNMIHTEAVSGEGTFKAAGQVTIPDLVLTNYTGEKPISGAGEFIQTRGDGFAGKVVLNQSGSSKKKKTVLILGNSLVRHAPSPGIGWYGDWGMAASVKDSDLVHLLISDIHQADPSAIINFKNINLKKNFVLCSHQCICFEKKNFCLAEI